MLSGVELLYDYMCCCISCTLFKEDFIKKQNCNTEKKNLKERIRVSLSNKIKVPQKLPTENISNSKQQFVKKFPQGLTFTSKSKILEICLDFSFIYAVDFFGPRE